eukprot:scaffold410_cov267-Chaetoceros_neogracile.AAC.15
MELRRGAENKWHENLARGDQLPPARLFLTASKIEVKSATMRQKDNRSELEKELRVRSIYCLLSWTHCIHSFAIVVT